HLLGQKRAARRQDTRHLVWVEDAVPVEHQVKFAVGKGQGVGFGEVHVHHLHAQRFQPRARQRQVRGVFLGGDQARRPLVAQREQLFAAACVQIERRGGGGHQLGGARQIVPRGFSLDHAPVEIGEVPAGKRLLFLGPPLGQ